MNCTYCSNTIDSNNLFCPWCGSKIDRDTEDKRLIQARGPRRSRNADFERARAIYHVWLNSLHYSKYANLEEYGIKELGLKRAQVYNYKTIGAKFIDDNYELRLVGDGNWTIGQLIELKALSLVEVNKMNLSGVIHPDMKCSQVRIAVQEWQAK